jgi:glycerate kinase
MTNATLPSTAWPALRGPDGLTSGLCRPIAPGAAVIELAAAGGRSPVPGDRRNPMLTPSFGVGALILAELDHKVERILVGSGDSGINDGGEGRSSPLGKACRCGVMRERRRRTCDRAMVPATCRCRHKLCGNEGVGTG